MATPVKDWKKEWEATAAKSRKLAKRANQRLKRLEDYAKKPGYSSITKYAYANAENYIRTFLKKEKGLPRFQERVKLDEKLKGADESEYYKKNVQKQRLHIKAMEEFLSSESSTLGQSRSGPKTKGIKAIYDKRAQTISDKFLKDYGYEMNADDLKRFFDSRKQAKLENDYGSNQMFIIASVIRKTNIGRTRQELEDYVKTHVKVSDPEELVMRKNETKAQYLERLRDKLNFTQDKVLDNLIISALQDGFNAKNLFI